MKPGQVIETSSGWFLEVSRINWWSDDDGEVFGRACAVSRGRWSREKYIGTVRGIQEMAVGMRFMKPKD